MLTGDDLLKKVSQAGDLSRSNLARECGYVSLDKSGREIINFTAFYEALIEAKGLGLEEQDLDEMEVSNEDPPPFIIASSSHSQQIISSDSDDEISLSAKRLLRLAIALQEGWEGSHPLAAIQIEYSGAGDDGTIDKVEYLFSSSAINGKNKGTAVIASCAPNQVSFEDKDLGRREYEDIIRDAAFSISYNSHGSWFNDSGGSGFLTVYIDRMVICGEHIQDAVPSDPSLNVNEITPYYLWVQDV